MAMGTRREHQEELWIPTCTLARPASHPFYQRLNQLLEEHDFDRFAEHQCRRFYAATMGRPGLAPGIYFRLLLVGYFEGIDSERGIAWRAGDSLSIRLPSCLAIFRFWSGAIRESPWPTLFMILV